jgi:dTDP-4-dehydrorhamnose reductase
MRILLTGSTGQVGHALLSALQGIGEIIVLTRHQMDLSKPDIVRENIQRIRPDLIINPAAYTAVDQAETEPEMVHLVNAIAPGIIAEETKKLGAALIHYSTDYVFDGQKKNAQGALLPYTEQDVTCPINVYGKTKLEGEELIRAMLRLAKERDELKVVDDQWGAPCSADWIAKTTADILKQLLSTDSPQEWWKKHGGLYNLTPAGTTNWCGFSEEIVRVADTFSLLGKTAPQVSGISSKEYPVKATRPVNSLLSTSLLSSHFDIQVPRWQKPVLDCLTAISNRTPLKPKIIPLRVMGDERGSLVAVESQQDIPFEIKRMYYIFGTKEGVERGEHAHKNLKQLAVAVRGSCTMVLDDGLEKTEFRLDDPTRGLLIGSMIWRVMKNFSDDCVLLVFADQHYTEDDYIRNYKDFLEQMN